MRLSSHSSPSTPSSIYLDPRFEVEELQDKTKTRRYAVDISPKLLHCDGSTVDALLAAGAGSYAEFKLVGAHLVWVREEEGEEETEKEEGKTAAASSSASNDFAFARGRLLPLPASRADVFRDRSLPLAAKRGVMRFLQQAADAVMGKGGPLAEALSVPSPLSPSLSLPSDDEASSSSSSSSVPFAAVVASANLPRGVADAVLYGLAGADADQGPWERGELMTAKEAGGAATEKKTAAARATATMMAPWASAPLPSAAAALSLRRHLLSLGRYGGASALLAPVHGTGELPQAFVRSAAVAGGAAALRRRVVSAFLKAGEEDGGSSAAPPRVRVTAVELSSGQRLECGALAGGRELVRALRSLPASPSPSLLPRVARCVAVLDGPPALSSSFSSSSSSSGPPPLLSAATAALVFPPRCLGNAYPSHAVRGLLVGSATASAPEGRWVLHLSTPLERKRSEEGDGEEGKKAAEAALLGALSALARPPDGCCEGPSSSFPPRALDHRPCALLAAFYETETGPEEECCSSLLSSSFLPRNAAATAPPDGRMSADDGPLSSARRVLERLFPGEGVEELLLEKKKKKKEQEKNEGTEDEDDEEEEAPAGAEAEAAAKENGEGERDDDCCSSDEDAAGDLAAVLAALDAAK